MPFPWVIVGGTGYDVEDVINPQTRDMLCPACEKHVRFVEKQMVKNLRVFGVPLVGVERGRRVFECPHCRACVEAPGGGVSDGAKAGGAASSGEVAADAGASARRAIEARLAKARDEMWLWQRRAELADKGGDADLYGEAKRLWSKAEHEVERLEAELAKVGPADRAAADEDARPVVVARAKAAGGGVEPAIDDEFAALKARLARRAKSGDEAQPSDEAPRPARSESVDRDDADVEADFDALQAKVGPGGGSLDDEVAALKARMAGGGGAVKRDAGAYDALKREVSEPERAPVASGATPSDGGDEDPAAALKRKLRKKG